MVGFIVLNKRRFAVFGRDVLALASGGLTE
jgi:hypothetical protein